MQIGFIGLGHMGGPMAINLVKAGHNVKVFDLSAAAIASVVAAGGQAAVSAQNAVQGAEVVISMLPASQHVESLYLGREGQIGLLASMTKGTLVIDSSTIAAATSRKVAEAAKAKGVAFIDAPVSGGTGGAIAGTPTFMVGGDAEALGKNLGDDLAEGKATLPLIHAMSRAEQSVKQRLRQIIETGDASAMPEVLAAIKAADSMNYSLEKAHFHADAAKAALRSVPDGQWKQALIELADYSVARKS